jgi:hypothetical protein
LQSQKPATSSRQRVTLGIVGNSGRLNSTSLRQRTSVADHLTRKSILLSQAVVGHERVDDQNLQPIAGPGLGSVNHARIGHVPIAQKFKPGALTTRPNPIHPSDDIQPMNANAASAVPNPSVKSAPHPQSAAALGHR